MKWFFALNDYSTAFELYSQMVKVAVYSAKQNTSLEPYCIYDGQENDFTAWLRRQGVQILFHRTPHYEKLKAIEPTKFAIGAGAFLRVEIPKLVKQHHWSDEYVLYTDVDVLFLQEVVPELSRITCHYFAVAPESDPQNWKIINSGVMLMNVKSLLEVYDSFNEFIDIHLHEFVHSSFDQEAFIQFFADQWQPLRLEMNWKSYWDENPETTIIHFHGPKPNEIEQIQKGQLHPQRMMWVNHNFCRNADRWHQLYNDILHEEQQRLQAEADQLMHSRSLLQKMLVNVLEFQGFALLPDSTEIIQGFSLDLPAQYTKIADNQAFVVSGWVLGKEQPPIAIELLAGAQMIASTPVSVYRPDVAKVYPQAVAVEFSGFTTVVEAIATNTYTAGLSLQAVMQDQSRVSLGKLQFRCDL